MTRLEIRFPAADVISAGALAGAVMAAFLMVASALFVDVNSVFYPFRMVAGALLGRAALEPGFPVPVAALTGFVLHMSLSVLFAFLFTTFVNPLWKTMQLTGAGIFFGAALWLINVQVVAAIMGWTWFVEQDGALISFVAHVFVYGCMLGWSLSAARPLIQART